MPHVREQVKAEVEAYLEENPEAEVRDVFDLLQGYENVKMVLDSWMKVKRLKHASGKMSCHI